MPRPLAFLLATLLAVPSALADEASRRASEHFAVAEQAEKRGDYRVAIEEYEHAYNAKPHPAVLYNIALVYQKLEEWGNAAHYFERYIEESGHPEDREEVLARIRELRRREKESRPPLKAGTGRLVVRVDVPGATIHLDGEPAGTAPRELIVSPGRHEIVLAHPGYRPRKRVVDVAAGGTEEIRERLEKIPGAPDPEEPVSPGRWVFGVGWGLDFLNGFRYLFSFGFRGLGDRIEATAVGTIGAIDAAIGLDGKLYLTTGRVRPYAHVSATLGRTFDDKKHATAGVEGGIGLAWLGTRLGSTSTVLSYYLSVDGRYVSVDLPEMSPDETPRFGVLLSFGLLYRF